MIRKYLLKPPSRNPVYWTMMITGVSVFVLGVLGFFGKGAMTLLMLLLGLQQAMIASAELLSSRRETTAWLRGISLVAGLFVLAIAYYIIWL